MKRITYLMILFSFFYLLTGCQQAPDEVIERMDNYQTNDQMKNQEAQYCSVEELRQFTLEDLGEKPQNFNLPEHIDFSNVEDINLLDIDIAKSKDFLENRDAVAELAGVKNVDWEEYSYDERELGNHYDDQSRKIYISLDDTGWFCFNTSKSYEDILLESTDVKYRERLLIDRGDSYDVNWNLAGEEVTVSEQVEYVENWLNNCELLDWGFTYKVPIVYLWKPEDDGGRITMTAQLMYHGIPLDYYGYKSEWIDENFVGIQTWSKFEINLFESKNITGFTTGFAKMEIENIKSISEVIDFESALKIVEQKLSGFQKVNIADVQIIYALYPNYEHEDGTVDYKYYEKMSARPVYSFVIDYGEDETVYYSDYQNTICYVNVDMMDGSVMDNFEERNFHIE